MAKKKSAGKRGRPPKPRTKRVDPIAMLWAYDPTWKANKTAAEVAAAFREQADRCYPSSEEQLAGWYRGIAESVEAGDAVRAGCCFLYALQTLDGLLRQHVLPLAAIGRRYQQGRAEGARKQKGKTWRQER